MRRRGWWIKRLTTGVAALAVALSLAASGTGTPLRGPARPDLTVLSIAVQPAAAPGARVAVIDVTKNAGRLAAPPSRTGYWFSRNRRLDGRDLAVGTHPVPRLRPGKLWRGGASVKT
ncbi:MAG: hypothetical protein QOF43_413, partial [Gaiellaceae bacterium]|nr:hypothetical protein [Gaiellaceae bacterium]